MHVVCTHHSTGLEPGLWNINTKIEGSELRGAAPKSNSSLVSVKTKGLETERGQAYTLLLENTDIYFNI